MPLSTLKALKFLYASYNKIKCLTGLKSLNSLIELDLEGNFVKETSDLNELSNLLFVNLTVNPVTQ